LDHAILETWSLT